MQSRVIGDLFYVYKPNLFERLNHGFDRIHPSVDIVVIGVFFFKFTKKMLVDAIEALSVEEPTGNSLDIGGAYAEETSWLQNPEEFSEDVLIVVLAEVFESRCGKHFCKDTIINREALTNVEDEVNLWEGDDIDIQEFFGFKRIASAADVELGTF